MRTYPLAKLSLGEEAGYEMEHDGGECASEPDDEFDPAPRGEADR